MLESVESRLWKKWLRMRTVAIYINIHWFNNLSAVNILLVVDGRIPTRTSPTMAKALVPEVEKTTTLSTLVLSSWLFLYKRLIQSMLWLLWRKYGLWMNLAQSQTKSFTFYIKAVILLFEFNHTLRGSFYFAGVTLWQCSKVISSFLSFLLHLQPSIPTTHPPDRSKPSMAFGNSD